MSFFRQKRHKRQGRRARKGFPKSQRCATDKQVCGCEPVKKLLDPIRGSLFTAAVCCGCSTRPLAQGVFWTSCGPPAAYGVIARANPKLGECRGRVARRPDLRILALATMFPGGEPKARRRRERSAGLFLFLCIARRAAIAGAGSATAGRAFAAARRPSPASSVPAAFSVANDLVQRTRSAAQTANFSRKILALCRISTGIAG